MDKLFKVILRIVILLLMFYGWLSGQGVRGIDGKHISLINQPELSLIQRIREAEERFVQNYPGDYFLTGYLFDARSNARTSGTYITSEKTEVSEISRNGDCLDVHHYGSSWDEQKDTPDCSVERAVIFLHRKTGTRFVIVDISVLNNECNYQIKSLPLYWFGKISGVESLDFLKQLFRTGEGRIQKHLLGAISFHDQPQALEFIYGVGSGRYPTEMRKLAVFWMGVIRGEKSFQYLKDLAKKEQDFSIRKQLVFAFYLNGSSNAVKELINIAREDESVSLRKKAIFWLGRKASQECVKALEEVIQGEDELAVKSSAVFAISQLPRERAVPMLIDIARRNRSQSIRKKAMFWLGQIDDERAVAFFEEILLK